MGMFDTFVGFCPKCGKEFNAQTKLYEECLAEYRIGDTVRGGPGNVKLELKDCCEHCHSTLVVAIENNSVISFQQDGATLVEGLWGKVKMPKLKDE
jgi:hypothetical protein